MMPEQPQFPALREFLRGYFHEDLEDEYGSPHAAAEQFWEDADDGQRKAAAAEWVKFLKETKTLNLDQVNQRLRELGSAWAFGNLAELQKISAVFRP